MKKPVLIVVVLLAVLAASAALFWRKDSADAGNGSGSATAGADASPAGQAPGVQAPLPARIADQPLPPVETPLRDTLADLQRRADRGEAGAACRLAAEWTYCQGLDSRMRRDEASLRANERMAERLTSMPQHTGRQVPVEALERSLDRAQAQADRSREQLQHCQDVTLPKPSEVARYWRQAALAGHLPSMRNYAVGNAFRRNQVLDNLPALEVYRQEALKIAEAAIARGDLPTAVALAGAYSPLNSREGTYLSQLVDDDAGKSLALLYRINAAAGNDSAPARRGRQMDLAGAIEDLEAMMTPEAVQQARTQAAAAPPLSAESPDRRRPYAMGGGFVGDVQREECDQLSWGKTP